MPVQWSDWLPFPLGEPLSEAVLAEILDGGQTFRWQRLPEGGWEGSWSTFQVRLRLAKSPAGELQFSAPRPRVTATTVALHIYFDAGRPTRLLTEALPWRSDPHLALALSAFPGLRILRQPFGEALLCFLCSAAKQIAQIKQMAAALSAPYGRLPTWPELAATPEAALRRCKLGFRARSVHRTADFLARHPGWLADTEALPYPEAKARLLELPGVGEKIADCVLLFGAGRLEAFPVDVWILKALERRYGLHGWKPAQLAQFGRIHFGPYAGLAQQYLFAWERRKG